MALASQPRDSRCVVLGDLDHDGDLDLVVNRLNELAAEHSIQGFVINEAEIGGGDTIEPNEWLVTWRIFW